METNIRKLFLVTLFLAAFPANAATDITVQGVLRDANGDLYSYTATTPSGITVQFRHIDPPTTPIGGTAYDT